MTNLSTYEPFLIGDGNSKTGLFQYYESWIKPGDAFDRLINAYVFRGTLQRRKGMFYYPSVPGSPVTDAAGSLVYATTQEIATTGGAGPYTAYSDTATGGVVLGTRPIVPGSVEIRVRVNVGGGAPQAEELWEDNGAGVLTNSAYSDTGTIAYDTGKWTLDLTTSGNTISNGMKIHAVWQYVAKGPLTAGSTSANPIMGIKTYTDQDTGVQKLVVFDTERISIHNGVAFEAVYKVENQVLGIGVGGAVVNYAYTSPFPNLAPNSVQISDGTGVINDDGNGGWFVVTAGTFTGAGTINYATGAITFTLGAASTATFQMNARLGGAYFTGDNSQFFNTAVWKPKQDLQTAMWITNNKDQVTLYTNTTSVDSILTRPPLSISQSQLAIAANDIQTCLDVKVYQNSMLLIRPILVTGSTKLSQSIISSIYSGNPLFTINNFVTNVKGNGAETVAPTGDWITSATYLRDVIVVWFNNSVWLFRYNNSKDDPFRFDRLNVSKSVQAPYASIEYDLQSTAVGNKGLIYCDGTNVERYDTNIIDQYLDIEPLAFNKTYGFRFDILQQAWMLYADVDDQYSSATVDELVSTRALIYNFLEETWAIFKPNLGVTEANANVTNSLSCLGLGLTTTDVTWASFAVGTGLPQSGKTWENWDEKWSGYLDQVSQPLLLGGDQNGRVYEINVTNQDQANTYNVDILTKRFNPYMPHQKAAFGYVDVYYEVAPKVTLTFSFYANESTGATMTQDIVLDTIGNANLGWKRLYLGGLIGQFLRIGITDNGADYWKILGIIVHAAPAGRLTPGSFL